MTLTISVHILCALTDMTARHLLFCVTLYLSIIKKDGMIYTYGDAGGNRFLNQMPKRI